MIYEYEVYGRMRAGWKQKWKEKYLKETYLSVTSSTTNPAWLDLGSNPGHNGRKLVTNHWSKDMLMNI
jgi:hypothetical protein